MTKEQYDKEVIAAAKKAMEKCIADPACQVGWAKAESYRDFNRIVSSYHFEFHYNSKNHVGLTVSHRVPTEDDTISRSIGIQEFYSVTLECRNSKSNYHYINAHSITNKNNPELVAAAKDLFDYAASKYPELEERSRAAEFSAEDALVSTKLLADVNYVIDTLADQ